MLWFALFTVIFAAPAANPNYIAAAVPDIYNPYYAPSPYSYSNYYPSAYSPYYNGNQIHCNMRVWTQ